MPDYANSPPSALDRFLGGVNVPSVFGFGAAARSPNVNTTVLPTPVSIPRMSARQIFAPGGMIPAAPAAPAPGFDAPQPDAIGWNKLGQQYRQGAIAAGGGGVPAAPYGDWTKGAGGAVSGFLGGLFGGGAPAPAAPVAPVSPTTPVSVSPVAQTPSGPAPVAPVNLSPNAPSQGDGLNAAERTAQYVAPGQFKGRDGIGLGLAPVSQAQKTQTMDDYLKDRFINAQTTAEKQLYGQMIQHTFTPAYQAQKQFLQEGQNIHNENMARIRNTNYGTDEAGMKARQDAISEEMTRHRRETLIPIGVPGALPYAGYNGGMQG